MTSCWVVIAPMTTSRPSSRMPLRSATPARSMRCAGLASRSFIIGIRLCPPRNGARIFAQTAKQTDGFLDRCRTVIGKWPRYHRFPPGRSLTGWLTANLRSLRRASRPCDVWDRDECASQQQRPIYDPEMTCTNSG